MATLANQLMSISELDEVVELCTITETLDDSGSLYKTTTVTGTQIRAKVRYERTNETGQENQEKFIQEVKVWIRYNTSATQYKSLYWQTKHYDIYAIETTPRNRFMILKCRLIET